MKITRHRAWHSPFLGKTVFACVAEKREYLLLLVTRFHMHQVEAVHALLSSFALLTLCVHAFREEEMYHSHSTNELVVPNALAVVLGWGVVPRWGAGHALTWHQLAKCRDDPRGRPIGINLRTVEFSKCGTMSAFETCILRENAFPRSTAGQWASDTSAPAKNRKALLTVFER